MCSGCQTRSGDHGSAAPDRHRMLIGLLNHRHDNRGGPFLQAPHDQHFQGRNAPQPAQATQERQLLLNLQVGHRWRHATETPWRRRSCRPLSDRQRKPAGGRRPVRKGGPKKKARSDTSLSERALPERSGERCCSSRFRNHRGTFMGGNVTWEIDCPNADELVQRLAAAGDQAGGSALYSPMYSPVLWAPPGWAIPR